MVGTTILHYRYLGKIGAGKVEITADRYPIIFWRNAEQMTAGRAVFGSDLED